MYDSFEVGLLKDLYCGKLGKTMYKTKCMDEFCLSSSQMEELSCEKAPNPHPYAKYPMKLYIVEQVLFHAIKKHGSWRKFILAREKKAERRIAKQEKQNNFATKSGLILSHVPSRKNTFGYEAMMSPGVTKQPDEMAWNGRLSGIFTVSRTLQSRKRPRDEFIAGRQQNRGLNVQEQDVQTNLESLATSHNQSNILIYHCSCGYAAGAKKMRRHLHGSHHQ